MKKRIFLSIVAILLIAGVAFALPGYRMSPGTGDILGQGKYQQDPHKIFRMVRYVPPTYAGSATLAADSIVTWYLVDDDGVTVTTSTTSHDSAVAGIISVQALTPDVDGNTAAEDVGKRNWTWLQTYGLAQVNVTTTITTAGEAMGTSGTAGEAAPFLPSVTQPALNGNAGFFYDSAATGADDVECFINLD